METVTLQALKSYLRDERARRLAGEFLRFATIGVGATAVHYAVLVALVELAHAPLVPATSVGFICGAVVSYTLNRRLTFAHQPAFGAGLAKFVVVGFVGLGLNALIVSWLHGLGLPYILAQMVATVVILGWNFVMARFVIFRPPPTDG